MGIDRLYAWIKYRAWGILSENVLLKELPENFQLHHLYVDFYNIIHECREELEKLPTEEKEQLQLLSNDDLDDILINKVLEKIKDLIEKTNPIKTVVICLDGVSNLQKINSKRHNAHLSHFYNYTLKNRKKDDIIDTSTERLFQCTAFGIASPFILKLENKLSIKLVSSDSREIIISKTNVPGEGEHKIMSHILSRNIPDEETIAIQGSDADLIVLSMLLRHNNVYIYRNDIEKTIEEKKNVKSSSSDEEMNIEESSCGSVSLDESNGEESDSEKIDIIQSEVKKKFQVFINIKLFRDELTRWMNDIIIPCEQEKIIEYSDSHLEGMDSRRFIDDFVFMTFFLGNDYIKSLKTINIFYDFKFLLEKYAKVYVSLNAGKKSLSYLINKEGNKFRINTLYLKELFYLIKNDERSYLQYFSMKRKDLKIPEGLTAEEEEKWKRDRLLYNDIYRRFHSPIDYRKSNWRFRYNSLMFNIDIDNKNSIDKVCFRYFQGLIFCFDLYFNQITNWNWFNQSYDQPLSTDLYHYLEKTSDINKIIMPATGEPLDPMVVNMIITPRSRFESLPKVFADILSSKEYDKYYPNPDPMSLKMIAWERDKIYDIDLQMPLMNIEFFKNIYEKNKHLIYNFRNIVRSY